MKLPLVSVVMSVYNGQEYLNLAIDSILLQSHKNLEFIVVDDGSTDHSAHIIKGYKDSRIRYIHQHNKGLSAALNIGIAKASGEYIARMDADDISYPRRIEKQVQFLEQNRRVGMVGTSFDLIDVHGYITGQSYHLDRDQDLNLEFLLRNPFGHGTVMIRRAILASVGGYDNKQPIEDYELWWRTAKKYEVANLPEQLYGYRILASSMSKSGSAKRQEPITKLTGRIWSESSIPRLTASDFRSGINHYKKLGPGYEEQYLYMHCALTSGLLKMGYRRHGLANLSRLLFIPGTARAFKDFRMDPFSHNYNLPIVQRLADRKRSST